jgi:hypothetical protein
MISEIFLFKLFVFIMNLTKIKQYIKFSLIYNIQTL